MTESGSASVESATSGSATSSGASAYRLVAPRYGGLVEVGTDSWAAWTGGEPKSDWSELKDPSPSSIEPNQYRSSSVTSQAKSQKYRVEGLTDKFSKDKDILVFAKEVEEHMKDHGMDTVMYAQDPASSNKVVSVLTEHGKFEVKEGVKSGNKTMKDHFDCLLYTSDAADE